MRSTVPQGTASPGQQVLGLALRRFGGNGPFARYESQLREVDDLLLAEIAEHRERPDLEEREDILSMLMTAEFEDGTRMEDKELRDQLMTLLLAGHETTATALAWTFDLLLRHPAVLGRLRDSLAAGEGDYLRATISESLRLPAGEDFRGAAAGAGDPAGRAPALEGARRQRDGAPGGDRRHPGDLAYPHP